MRRFVVLGLLLVAAVAHGRDKQSQDAAAAAKAVVLFRQVGFVLTPPAAEVKGH